MDSKPAITGIKKRQQIQSANRIVFIWVAIAGVAVAVSIVLTQFVVKQLLFNNKVIAAQVKTNDTLVQNASVYEPLRTDVSKLVANQDLTRLRVQETDNSLQVIIDAMPTEHEPIALIASLQQVILARSGASVSDVSLIDAAPTVGTTETTVAAKDSEGLHRVAFGLKATGSYDSIKKLLQDMHDSIRPISVTSMKVSGSSSAMSVEIIANTFYATPRTVEMTKESINP